MKNNFFWFYIEPHIYFSKTPENILFYNTIEGTQLLYHRTTRIYKMFCFDTLKINYNDLSIPEVKSFIKEAREGNFGDLMDSSYSPEKPLEMITPLNNWSRGVFDKDQSGLHVVSQAYNLKEISIYINDKCDIDCSQCKSAYKQLLCCTKGNNKELDYQDIMNFLEDRPKNLNLRVNILGGNILRYSKLKEFTNGLIKDQNILKVFYIHYLNVAEYVEDLLFLLNPYVIVNIVVTCPVKTKFILNTIERLLKHNIRIVLTFLVENEDDLDVVERITLQIPEIDFIVAPFYNGNNLNFFKELVFLTKESILESKPSVYELIGKKMRNANFFGKFTIMSTGDIYSNVNRKPLGNMKDCNMLDIIQKEMEDKTSWYLLRQETEPCINCIYSLICPSISNFEFAIGKNNLCNVYP